MSPGFFAGISQCPLAYLLTELRQAFAGCHRPQAIYDVDLQWTPLRKRFVGHRDAFQALPLRAISPSFSARSNSG